MSTRHDDKQGDFFQLIELRPNNDVPPPTYTDGVRAVIDILDKFKVDICAALEYGNNSHTYDDLCEKVVTGKLIFMPLPNSVMICEVVQHPQHKTYHCFVAAGDLEELLTLGTSQLRLAARAHMCKHLSVVGRMGWKKKLEEQGWENPLVVMYKEVY